jgi:hypothetical protein
MLSYEKCAIFSLWSIFCIFTTASRTALGPTQPPIKWVPRTLSLGVKGPGREADYSPTSSAEVKEYVKPYLYSPWRGAQFKKSAGINIPLPVFCISYKNMAAARNL